VPKYTAIVVQIYGQHLRHSLSQLCTHWSESKNAVCISAAVCRD